MKDAAVPRALVLSEGGFLLHQPDGPDIALDERLRGRETDDASTDDREVRACGSAHRAPHDETPRAA